MLACYHKQMGGASPLEEGLIKYERVCAHNNDDDSDCNDNAKE